MLIALGRKAYSAIKKPVEQTQQFHLAVNFNRAAFESRGAPEIPRDLWPRRPLGDSLLVGSEDIYRR
jgi:hypothetical protein